MSDHEDKHDEDDSGESVVRNYVSSDKPGSEFETREMPALVGESASDDDGDETESVGGVFVNPMKPGSNDPTIATTRKETEARKAARDAESNEDDAYEDEFATVEKVAAVPDRPGSTSETKVFERVDDDAANDLEDGGEAPTKLAGGKVDPFDDLETREVPTLKDEWKQRAAEATESEAMSSDDSWGGGVVDASLAASVAAASGELPLPTTEEPSEVAGPVIRKAREAQAEWSKLRFEQKLPYFDALRAELVSQRTDYVPSMATAIGRPMVETLVGEFLPVLEALRTLDEVVPPLLVDQHTAGPGAIHEGISASVRMVPYGVVVICNGSQSPFAFPMTLAIDALVTGNAVLICAAEQHPRINETMRKLFRRANFPEGLLQVIGGDTETKRVVVEARADKVVYEGNDDLAARLAAICADTGCEFQPVRKAKDMMLVLKNADLDRAVDAALTSAFSTGGMQQGTLERIVVDDKIYDEFRMRFIDAIRTMNSHHAQLATINDTFNMRRAQMLLDDAIAKGARVTYPAGEEPGRWIHWKATVIESLGPKAKLSTERLEGPGCELYRSEEPDREAARLLRLMPANNLSVLGTPERIMQGKLEDLPAGRIAFNEPVLVGTAGAGGVPIGAESPRSICGPQNMLRPKLISQGEDEGRRIAWFPYTDDKAYALMDAIEAIYGTQAGKRLKAALKLWINPTKRRLLKGDD